MMIFVLNARVIANEVKQSKSGTRTDCRAVPPRSDDGSVIANEVKQPKAGT